MASVPYHPGVMEKTPPSDELTIDELAQLTGTTVRNIRAYQSRGLLPPPAIRARTGYYGPDHVSRLRMIQAMEAGEELAQMGIPLSHALAVAEQIERHTRAIAEAYVRLFLSDIVGGDGLGERPAEDWQRLSEALERLRPMAVEAVRAGFEQAM